MLTEGCRDYEVPVGRLLLSDSIGYLLPIVLVMREGETTSIQSRSVSNTVLKLLVQVDDKITY